MRRFDFIYDNFSSGCFCDIEASPEGVYVDYEDAKMLHESLEWLINLHHDAGKRGGRPLPGEWEEAIKQAERILEKVKEG